MAAKNLLHLLVVFQLEHHLLASRPLADLCADSQAQVQPTLLKDTEQSSGPNHGQFATWVGAHLEMLFTDNLRADLGALYLARGVISEFTVGVQAATPEPLEGGLANPLKSPTTGGIDPWTTFMWTRRHKVPLMILPRMRINGLGPTKERMSAQTSFLEPFLHLLSMKVQTRSCLIEYMHVSTRCL